MQSIKKQVSNPSWKSISKSWLRLLLLPPKILHGKMGNFLMHS